MARKKSTKTQSPDTETPAEILSPDEQNHRMEAAIEKAEKLAESEMEMARLFLARGKDAIAQRRLELVLEKYPQSDSARNAEELLRQIRKAS